jgi:transcriptional regulator with XRE-family HTH domain
MDVAALIDPVWDPAVVSDEMARRGWTQKELAERAGITESAVSRYLSGRRTPRLEALRAMAAAFGDPAEDPRDPRALEASVKCVADHAEYLTVTQTARLADALARALAARSGREAGHGVL